MRKLIHVKKRLSKRWLIMDDEPPHPYTVEWELDDAGWGVVNGERSPETCSARPGKVVDKLRPSGF